MRERMLDDSLYDETTEPVSTRIGTCSTPPIVPASSCIGARTMSGNFVLVVTSSSVVVVVGGKIMLGTEFCEYSSKVDYSWHDFKHCL